MFNKKFKIVLFLAVAIILLSVFGKDLVNRVTSNNVTKLTEPTFMSYYKKSCDYQDSSMCNKLGDMYHYGLNKVSVDFIEAVEYYKKSCALDDGKGCNNLAYMLNKGQGIKHNDWKAIRMYKKACKLNEMEACYNVGAMYYHGEGTRKNYHRAVEYFRKSCNHGIAAGCNNLGYMHEHGKYLEASIHKALTYYLSACDRGDISGCKNLAYLREKKGHLKPAKQFYLKACDLGDAYSCNRLENFLGGKIYVIKDELALEKAKNACKNSTKGTMCYRVGLYYEANDEMEKAREYFVTACDRQQSQSCKHLGDIFAKKVLD